MVLRRIIYTSKAKKKFSKRNLLDLLHEARAYNTLDNITGILMHREGCFLQVIEGESNVINNLVTRLKRDARHNEFKIIFDSSVNNRFFSNWAMGCADFDQPELSLIPGIRTDLSDPKVIESLINNLPEVATFLLENHLD
jgi:hypothetical protein